MVKLLSGWKENLGATKKSKMSIKIETKNLTSCMMDEFAPTREEFEVRRSMSSPLTNLASHMKAIPYPFGEN